MSDAQQRALKIHPSQCSEIATQHFLSYCFFAEILRWCLHFIQFNLFIFFHKSTENDISFLKPSDAMYNTVQKKSCRSTCDNPKINIHLTATCVLSFKNDSLAPLCSMMWWKTFSWSSFIKLKL